MKSLLFTMAASLLAAAAAQGRPAQPPSASVPAQATVAGREPDPPSSAPRYDPHEAFARLVLPEAVNRYRSANGAPGPDYWQNRAD